VVPTGQAPETGAVGGQVRLTTRIRGARLPSAAYPTRGRYPKDRARSHTFVKPDLVKVYCRIHSQMSAAALVLDHPFFSEPNDDGTFALPNVPSGEYTLVGWHERVGERTVAVRVEPGKTTDIELSLPVEDSR